jgi:hypothetical protein
MNRKSIGIVIIILGLAGFILLPAAASMFMFPLPHWWFIAVSILIASGFLLK